MIGTTVGKYEVIERLGAGGMGVVYRARDTRLGRWVALKFLPPHFSDPETRTRFLREAQAASALDHPAICTIYEIGESADGAPFLAMAHYEGETLRARLARGPLAIDAAIALVSEVALGLAAAHARGIVHRDVKPANLFLVSDGQVKILDFGLALREGDEKLTRSGMMMGTPAYMSPEQLQGGAVDARSDLWSLGVVLHECLVGARPFAGATDVATFHAVLATHPAPPSRLRQAVPEALDGIVAGLLRKSPSERTPDAATLVRSLRALARTDDASAPTRGFAMPEERSAPAPAPDEPLEAYEHCARGLQAVFEMSSAGFARAADAFAAALAIDPGYAMAHSGLGQMRAMRYIATTERADLEAAIVHLGRAVELDPDLADPQLWLTYSMARLDRFAEAFAAGRRATALEPGNALSHYFLAVAFWLKATLAGAAPEEWREAAEAIARSTRLAPRNQSAFLVQSDLYLRAGQYDAARAAAGCAAAIERSGDFENARFVGGQTMLATVLAREGRHEEAETAVGEALELLNRHDHVYRAMFSLVAKCQLAELLFLRRDYSSTLPLLRRARAEAEESRGALAVGWPRVRIELLLSAVFGRLHLVREQRAAAAAALELLEGRAGFDWSGGWLGGGAELRFELANCQALAGERDAALASLELAIDAGWRERPRLFSAPGISTLAGHARLAAAARRLDALPPLPEPAEWGRA